MDPRYQWPPQAYQNGQYVPQPPPQQQQQHESYQYQQQPQYHGYTVQQSPQQQVPQYRPQYQQYQQYSQPLPPPVPVQQMQAPPPRVVVPQQPRPNPQYGTPQNGMGAPPPRQVQPQVLFSPRPIMSSSSSPLPTVNTPNQRLHQTHVAMSPPVQQQHQYRAPMPPQSTPQHRMSSSTMSAPQQSSPRLPHTPSSQARHPQVIVRKTTPSSSSSQNQNQSKNQSQSQPRSSPTKALPTDLKVLLLQTADEYIDAARSMGSTAALAQQQEDLELYRKLMAMGLGCLEAALKKFSHSPRDQAKQMLRYASLLVEETTENVQIEELLSKGVRNPCLPLSNLLIPCR